MDGFRGQRDDCHLDEKLIQDQMYLIQERLVIAVYYCLK